MPSSDFDTEEDWKQDLQSPLSSSSRTSLSRATIVKTAPSQDLQGVAEEIVEVNIDKIKVRKFYNCFS